MPSLRTTLMSGWPIPAPATVCHPQWTRHHRQSFLQMQLAVLSTGKTNVKCPTQMGMAEKSLRDALARRTASNLADIKCSSPPIENSVAGCSASRTGWAQRSPKSILHAILENRIQRRPNLFSPSQRPCWTEAATRNSLLSMKVIRAHSRRRALPLRSMLDAVQVFYPA